MNTTVFCMKGNVFRRKRSKEKCK